MIGKVTVTSSGYDPDGPRVNDPTLEPINVQQCKKCPWRVGVNPRDIPNKYCEMKHRNLEDTIAREGDFNFCELKMMACHDSPEGEPRPCVGWMHHQLGVGNNIGLRIMHSQWWKQGLIKGPLKLIGKQHKRFEDTLPEPV